VTLLIWISTRRENPFADDQAREALNFQLCYAVVACCSARRASSPGCTSRSGWSGAVLSIVAAVNAGDGLKYRYPFIFRLIQ
jgi:uncharacterized Tic20 family protein